MSRVWTGQVTDKGGEAVFLIGRFCGAVSRQTFTIGIGTLFE